MTKPLEQILKDTTGITVGIRDVITLHGDASYRTYSRAQLDDGSSVILMQMPAGKASASEEITNFTGTMQEPSFINVQRYLAGLGMPVPKILGYDEERALMILEDLGDDLMARRVEKADAETQRHWYGQALDLLVALQEKTKAAKTGDCIALKRSFDARLLNWEFDHFREYGIEARRGKEMAAADRAIFDRATRAISAQIEWMPSGFTHRDFQSRNLIISNERLHLIDFQDALIGPHVYDLTALTRDSYVVLPDALIDELVGRYAERVRRDVDEVRREYDLVTVQRKLKDAGRFVYIDRVKGNPNFLPYIPTSLGYVRAALERLPELAPLADAIAPYVPEWS